MSKRSYGQYCGVAHALDLIGERWSLLLIRELLTGPKRYKDLLKRLPGIGTNLLAKRLKFLDENGLVERRTLPPPASTEAYTLTALGQGLEPVLIALAQWGYQTIPPPSDETIHFASWSVLAMKAVFRVDRAQGVDDEYEYRIDDEVFYARVKNGRLTTGQGSAPHPDFVLETDAETFLALVSGTLEAEDVLRQGLMDISGNMKAFARSTEIFDLSPIHSSESRMKVLDLTGRPGGRAHRLR
ncbi:MAG: winged helix-turn-helix transcriptional regulator [Rhodothermales bacterium]